MLLVDEYGVPLSLVVIGPDRHDVTQLELVLDAVVIARPQVSARSPQHLCADAGFTGEPAERAMGKRCFIPHVRSRGEERCRRIRTAKPRRRVVEVAHAWFNRFLKLLVRDEKTHCSYFALNLLAAALICFRKVPTKVNIIYG